MKHILTVSAIVAALALTACGGESRFPEATGSGTVRAINAISTSPAISFLIEERPIASVNYKAASTTAEYDDLDYTFNFEVLLAGDTSLSRVASQSLDVVRDTDYTFVITGDIASPAITLWESPRPEFGDNSTNFEIRFAHLDSTVGNIDVYFAAPGIVPVLGEQIGTLAFGEVLPAIDREAGDYVVTITPAGDPGSILFQSSSITPEATTSLMFSTFEPDANDLGPVFVRGFNLTSGATIPLPDANLPATLRFFHGNFAIGAADIYIDDPLTAPLVANHAFGDITGDLSMPGEVIPLTYTAAENIGSILLESERTLTKGVHHELFLIRNSSGDDVLVDHVPDRRSVSTLARLSLMNTAGIGVNLDVYFVPVGEAIDERLPTLAAVPVGIDPISFTLVEGSLDVWVTPTGEKTPLAGPVALDLALGDVVDIVLYETGDPSALDVVFVPLP